MLLLKIKIVEYLKNILFILEYLISLGVIQVRLTLFILC